MQVCDSRRLMGCVVLVCVVMLGVLAQAQAVAADLEIRNIFFCDSKYGEPLKGSTYLPGQVIYLNFDVGEMSSMKLDANGRFHFTVDLEVIDQKGGAVLKRGTLTDLQERNSFKAPWLRVKSTIELPPKMPVGTYTVNIYLKDVASGAQANKTVQFRLGLPALGVVNLRLTADAEGNIDRAPRYVVGESLFVHYNVVGFKRRGDTISIKQDMIINDEKGNTVTEMLSLLDYKGEVGADLAVIPVNNSLVLNRTGKYTVLIRFKDVVAGLVVERHIPIEIVDSTSLWNK